VNQKCLLYLDLANRPSARRSGSPRNGASAPLPAERASSPALSSAGNSMA